MSPIAIRGLLRRRRRLAVIAALLVLGCGIALHHHAPAIGDAHGSTAAGAIAQMCLGLLAAVGAAVVAVAAGMGELRRSPAWLIPAPATARAARARLPRGRDGPTLLALLCVCRR